MDGRWLAPPLLLGAALSRSRGVQGAVALALLAAGWLAGAAATAPAPLLRLADTPSGLAGPWEVAARVAREPEPGREGARLWLDVERVRVSGDWRALSGRVEVSLPRGSPELLPGTRVEAFLSLRADRPPRNPGAPFRDRLGARGVAARASLKSPEQLRIRAPAEPAAAAPAHLRQAIRAAISARLEGRARALALALLLGERGEIDDSLATRMGNAGLAHLLSVSGLHVGLLAGFVVLATRTAGASPRLAAGAGLLAAAAMAFLVVPRAPVARATLMAAVMLGGRTLDRRVRAGDALLLAVMMLTWWQPEVVRDPGFRLTVGATAGLVLLTPGPGQGWQRIAATLCAPLAAQAAVAPIIAESASLPLAGVPLNVVAIPLLGVAMPALLFSLGLHAIDADAAAGILAGASTGLLAAIVALADAAALLPAAVVALPSASWNLAIGWWLGLLGVRRHRGALLLLAAVAALAAQAPAPGAARLVALDVGQGDALLLQVGADAVLVDAGGYPGLDWSTGAHVVVPALHRLGVARLRAVSVSHAHADHADGVPAVLEALHVQQLWIGAAPPSSALQSEVLRAAASRRTPALTPRAPQRIGTCRFVTLPPPERLLQAGTREVENDASLVHVAECGRHAVLLTGDAGGEAEGRWAAQIGPGAILKVGHHGSRSATHAAMLQALRPGMAIISAGAGNRFGLPADEVVARLRAASVPVYRTDRDGALLVQLGERRRVLGLRWSAGDGDISPR